MQSWIRNVERLSAACRKNTQFYKNIPGLPFETGPSRPLSSTLFHFSVHPFIHGIHDLSTQHRSIEYQSLRSPTSQISSVNRAPQITLPTHMPPPDNLDLWPDGPNEVLDIGTGWVSNLSLHTAPILIGFSH
ncbi:hypothetical protein AVEN_131962-1 [Araneus ventricosus]|uniref:Uncharacterized protein n=1 Tax=Araneus ventricosus TaxID=182803 RepID=A0A4Y2B439_ARAVE|nr:hypothetical protein AVEN_131962-1 [Araneus ventricosus]